MVSKIITNLFTNIGFSYKNACSIFVDTCCNAGLGAIGVLMDMHAARGPTQSIISAAGPQQSSHNKAIKKARDKIIVHRPPCITLELRKTSKVLAAGNYILELDL